MTKEALDVLFSENVDDKTKKQSYKDTFKEYELPNKYYMLEMYNKQKELQQFLAERGKTQSFPNSLNEVDQPSVQLAVYHLFCMQIEFAELKEELHELQRIRDEGTIDDKAKLLDARYELIDMFFFMFNVGIYTGLNMQKVVDFIQNKCIVHSEDKHGTQHCEEVSDLAYAITNLMNYIDKLPWKAWKEYDYQSMYSISGYEDQLVNYYALAINACTEWAKLVFAETDESLFNLYMNKWEENHRRQLDVFSGYVLNKVFESDSSVVSYPVI